MKKKLNLTDLSLNSFVTGHQANVKGGAPYTYRKNCDPETLIPLCVETF